jgi:hypothetical protein
MNEERVVQVARIAPIPELGQVLENLIVVLRRADRYFHDMAFALFPLSHASEIAAINTHTAIPLASANGSQIPPPATPP